VRGYSVNNDNSDLYKRAIEKSLKIKPMHPSSVTHSLSQDTKTSCYLKSKEKLAGPPNYWFHPKIHTFGNTGVMGGLHAALAPIATKLIDVAAYDGNNVRDTVASQLREIVGKARANVADLCCGVGISTRSLRKSFADANTIIGVDTSKEMIAMAKFLSFEPDTKTCSARYVVGNSEKTNFPSASFDLVTIMYAFHEAPYLGRYSMLREARRILVPGGTLAIVDISPNYQPSISMLAGEPYVLEYKRNIHDQLNRIQGFESCSYVELVEGHVGKWILTRKNFV
jgi:ubiquinone/menaquinone biosynthesis C-methylase UbiE